MSEPSRDPLRLTVYRGLLVRPKLFGLFPSTAGLAALVSLGVAIGAFCLGAPAMVAALVAVPSAVALAAVLRGVEAGRSVPWLESLPARLRPRRWVPHREIRR